MWLCLYWGYQICSERLSTHSHGFTSHMINTSDDMEVKRNGCVPSGSPPERAHLLLGPPPTSLRWHPGPLTHSSLFKWKQRPCKNSRIILCSYSGDQITLNLTTVDFRDETTVKSRFPYVCVCGELEPSHMMCSTPRCDVRFNAVHWDRQWRGGKMLDELSNNPVRKQINSFFFFFNLGKKNALYVL